MALPAKIITTAQTIGDTDFTGNYLRAG